MIDISLYFSQRVSVMRCYTNFNNFSVISWWSIYWWRKPEYQEKTTYLMLYQVHFTRFKITTLVMIGTDCTGSIKSNYHTTTTTPNFTSDTIHLLHAGEGNMKINSPMSIILNVLLYRMKPRKHLRIDRNFCSVHEEITSIRLYTPWI